MDFAKLFANLLDQIDFSVVFVVQLVTSVIKTTLNILPLTRGVYTDFLTPYVACLVGIAFGFVRNDISWDSLLYGLALGGGAIVFQTLYDKGATGIAVLRGTYKNDPVLQAKAQKSAADADKLITAMKNRLKPAKATTGDTE